MSAASSYSHDQTEAVGNASGEVGIEEQTGRYLPKDLSFQDDEGREVRLGDVFGKPAILTLVYYTCDSICPFLLSGLSQAVPRLAMAKGKDYRIITVSFDETDTPQTMRAIRKNYIGPTEPDASPGDWRLLTGNRESIAELTKAVGFRFRKVPSGFDHPVVLIFLSPDGKISKYLQATKFSYGAAQPIAFSSFELNLALTEASEGKAVSGLKKAILYCFSHEPPGQSKFFNFMAVIGLGTLLAMVSFFIYLQWSSKRYRRNQGYDDGK
jgi:protein SCO1